MSYSKAVHYLRLFIKQFQLEVFFLVKQYEICRHTHMAVTRYLGHRDPGRPMVDQYGGPMTWSGWRGRRAEDWQAIDIMASKGDALCPAVGSKSLN